MKWEHIAEHSWIVKAGLSTWEGPCMRAACCMLLLLNLLECYCLAEHTRKDVVVKGYVFLIEATVIEIPFKRTI